GRFAAAPDGAGLSAAFGESFGQIGGAGAFGEPGRIADSGVHGDGNGQRAAGDQIVDDGGDGVDADVAIEAFAGEVQHDVGDEIFGAQSFFDVGEIVIGGFEQ